MRSLYCFLAYMPHTHHLPINKTNVTSDYLITHREKKYFPNDKSLVEINCIGNQYFQGHLGTNSQIGLWYWHKVWAWTHDQLWGPGANVEKNLPLTDYYPYIYLLHDDGLILEDRASHI